MVHPLLRFLPWLDLRQRGGASLGREVLAAAAITVLAVPQALAYAIIAGLPPVMGLYAAALPALVGGLMRSSRQVVTGPTNAVSLLIGTAVVSAGLGAEPAEVALTLALMVGALQAITGVLHLGGIVDFVSSSVVLGYTTGAGVLIAAGQLGNVTATPAGGSNLIEQVGRWVSGLGGTDGRAVALALGTAAFVIGLRRVAPRAPGSVLAMVLGIGLSVGLDLGGLGLKLVRDIAPVPSGLPGLTAPSLALAWELLPMAIAVMVLSLTEATAVARAMARKSGQRVDPNVEFVGQGLANVAAAFTGGYPVSGSLARSALAERLGSRTRLAGALSGVGVLLVLLVAGPVVDQTPVASLAGLLLVIARDLIDLEQISAVLRSRPSDALAFVGTLLGTFVLPLNQAIYLGVGISLVLFLRRARLLVVREITVDEQGRLREAELGTPDLLRCPAIRVVLIEGSLFFGASNELRAHLEAAAADPKVRVVIARIKRARGLDYTTALALEDVHASLASRGQHLLLVGVRAEAMHVMERAGVAEVFGEDLYPTRAGWFVAMHEALEHALELAGEHDPDCPLQAWVDQVPPVVLDTGVPPDAG